MPTTIPDASAEMILAAAEAVYYTRPSFELPVIARYMRASEDRAQEALKAAVMLGLLQETGGVYHPVEDILRLEIHADNARRRVIFRFRVEQFAPYGLFKERVLSGDSALESAEKVKALQGVDTDPTKLKEIFQQWGLYANSLSQDGLGMLVAPVGESLEPSYLTAIQSSVSSADQARNFIRARLGEDYFTRLPTEAVDNLTSALTRCQSKYDPKRDIGFALGTAFEKVLSLIAANASPAVNLAGTSGINQMADRLRSANVITGKHIGLVNAIGAVRNASDHPVDSEIGKAWGLRHDSLMDAALLSLDIIRSLMEWTTRQSALI